MKCEKARPNLRTITIIEVEGNVKFFQKICRKNFKHLKAAVIYSRPFFKLIKFWGGTKYVFKENVDFNGS